MGVRLPSFSPKFRTTVPPWWNGRHGRLKICILSVQVRQEVFCSLLAVRPDDGMVDVTDLGSVFWQFKSASGHSTQPPCPLGEMVDTAALKAAPPRGIGSSPVVGSFCYFARDVPGSYSLSVK